ncbi:MAG: hypothetical protein AAF430_13615 [Myxococcota bacterium]
MHPKIAALFLAGVSLLAAVGLFADPLHPHCGSGVCASLHALDQGADTSAPVALRPTR